MRLGFVCAVAISTVPAIMGAPFTSRSATRSGIAAVATDPYQIRTVCTAFPVVVGRRISAADGAALQQALDTANAGDTIVLPPGATFHPTASDGSFVLKNRGIPPGQWVVIRSASPAFDAGGALPAGTRATEANAALMPKIRANRTNAPAFRAEPRARGYRLMGLDIGIDDVGAATHESRRARQRRRRQRRHRAVRHRHRPQLPSRQRHRQLPPRRRDERREPRGHRLDSREFSRCEQRLSGDRRLERRRPFKIVNNLPRGRERKHHVRRTAIRRSRTSVPSDIEGPPQPEHQTDSWQDAHVAGQERVRAEERAPRARPGQHVRARLDVWSGRHGHPVEVGESGRHTVHGA